MKEKIYYYYYDPKTGVFKLKTNQPQHEHGLPYVTMPRSFTLHLHRVNVETGEIEAI